jgi:hypothetical protein
MLDHEVKVGDSFGIVLGICVFTTPRIGPVDQTRVGLIVRAATMNVEGRRRLGLQKQKAIQCFTCKGKLK